MEEIMVANLYKESRIMQENRNIYDQFDNVISSVDHLLYNEFDSTQLIKLQLQFLSFLVINKQYMSKNFDDETNLLI